MGSGSERERLRTSRQVLRGGTLIPVPFVLIGLVAAAVSLLNLGWTASRDGDGSAWTAVIVFGLVAIVMLGAAGGCRVVLRSGVVLDQVAFVSVRRIPQREIVAVRTRAGPWRTFEIETREGAKLVLLGCGPLQFPANLMADAAERDLTRIDMIAGSVRS